MFEDFTSPSFEHHHEDRQVHNQLLCKDDLAEVLSGYNSVYTTMYAPGQAG